jgi:hypothetical protein
VAPWRFTEGGHHGSSDLRRLITALDAGAVDILIVIAAGTESEGELAHRGAIAVAERLGTAPVIFPSGHGGFLSIAAGGRVSRAGG